ncbi:MAG: hypothetical protein L3K00_03895 [Thermoplasmata archaeon]|nr:hypothetical protein [Thermoplasmata archaeon]
MAAPGPTRRSIDGLRNATIALIVAVAIISVVLWATFELPSSPPPNAGCGPCGSATAIGTPTAQGGPGDYSYVMGITPSSGLRWGGSSFEITTSSGKLLTPTSSWTVVIFSSGAGGGSPVAAYDFTSTTWTSGWDVLATSGQTIHLELGATDLHGQADKFLLFLTPTPDSGQGGSISTSLP